MDTQKWMIWLVVALAVIVALPILTMLVGGTTGGGMMGGGMMGSGGIMGLGGMSGTTLAVGLLWVLAAIGLLVFLVAMSINAARRNGRRGPGSIDQPSPR